MNDNREVEFFWISDSRYLQPRHELVSELQMFAAMGAARGEYELPLAVFVAYEDAEKRGAVRFVPNTLTSGGGYIVSIDAQVFEAGRQRSRKKPWWRP